MHRRVVGRQPNRDAISVMAGEISEVPGPTIAGPTIGRRSRRR
jgi:hypothetical protein